MIPGAVRGLPIWVALLAATTAVAFVRDHWLAGRARDAVERWAREHNFRIVRCRRAWLAPLLGGTTPAYGATGLRGARHVYSFEVAVEDRELGGLSRGHVSVRGDWIGGFDAEVDVAWAELNVPDPTAAPPGPAWDAAQLALLRRVANGETTFRPDDRHSAAAGARFDLLVEHLQAMRRRGLVDFPAPLAEVGRHGRQYGAVTGVALTDAGRGVLARTA